MLVIRSEISVLLTIEVAKYFVSFVSLSPTDDNVIIMMILTYLLSCALNLNDDDDDDDDEDDIWAKTLQRCHMGNFRGKLRRCVICSFRQTGDSTFCRPIVSCFMCC